MSFLKKIVTHIKIITYYNIHNKYIKLTITKLNKNQVNKTHNVKNNIILTMTFKKNKKNTNKNNSIT